MLNLTYMYIVHFCIKHDLKKNCNFAPTDAFKKKKKHNVMRTRAVLGLVKDFFLEN